MKKLLNAIAVTLMALCFVAPSLGADKDRNLLVSQVNNQVKVKRVALVIGNGSYTTNLLLNPVNDAQDVAEKLRMMDFDVVERENLQVKQIEGTLNEFRKKLEPGGIALVFYSGHGIQYNGENYFPAVDAEIASENDVSTQSISMRKLMELLGGGKSRFNLIFLEASHDNFFTEGFRSPAGKGLAPIKVPSGTLISYAALPGRAEAFGNGRNGLYTGKLIDHMGSGIMVDVAVKQVAEEVKTSTHGQQVPWVAGEAGNLCFAGCGQDMQNLPVQPVSSAALEIVPVQIGSSQPVVSQVPVETGSADQPLAELKAAFEHALTYKGPPSLQVALWERFLADYGRIDLHNDEYTQLKIQAQSKKLDAEKRMSVSGAPVQPVVAAMTPAQNENVFRDCPDCPEMIKISAGSFDMGSSNSEHDAQNNEFPRHKVSIGSFAIGKYEVTVGQFAAFVRESGYDAGANCNLYYISGRADGSWRDPGFHQDAKQPAVCLNWNDAQAYAQWLSNKTGKKYRLPSESEWEYAARAGGAAARSWGDDVGRSKANCVGCGSRWENKQTSPVGSFAPNAFGVYDMLGNAMEWSEDCLHDSYNGAPNTETPWVTSDCGRRVLRGGSWIHSARLARSAARYWSDPAFRSYFTGFRLVSVTQ